MLLANVKFKHNISSSWKTCDSTRVSFFFHQRERERLDKITSKRLLSFMRNEMEPVMAASCNVSF